MSSAVQVCWEKFCNYFDVEPRYVPISEDHKVLDGHDLDKYVDENTIGVVAIMGVTYTGMYEPVEQISEALDRIEERTGLDVRIHVDGASGGMIAPFIQPDLAWDFRVKRVYSISTSGHKYGLVYPGLGWIVWRETADLPESLYFQGELSRRRNADFRTELLPSGRTGTAAVLHVPAFGIRRVSKGAADFA